jgi:uncharacterized protein
VPAGTYRGQDLTVPTVSVMAWLVARADIEDDTIYAFTRAIYDNLDTLHGPGSPDRLKAMTLERALDGLSIELHPGAAPLLR